MSGGTEIKYVDTKTGEDVSGYGNIIGAMFKSIQRNATLVLTRDYSIVMYVYGYISPGYFNADFSMKEDIRVFYF